MHAHKDSSNSVKGGYQVALMEKLAGQLIMAPVVVVFVIMFAGKEKEKESHDD